MPPGETRPITNGSGEDDLAERASRLRLPIMRLSRGLRRRTVGELTPAQFSALARIAEFGPVTLGRLAEIEKVKPPSITRMVGVLEERGLITRELSEPDRRCVSVTPTPEGWALLEHVKSSRDTFLAERLASLSAEDLERLDSVVEILERLAEEVRPEEELG